MVHCFLTGVGLSMDQAFVLNRREARELLALLNERMTSLQRVIAQFGPLDDEDLATRRGAGPRSAQRRKHHRLVCQAVAVAMAQGFPEIELFQSWPAHRAGVQAVLDRSLRSHPVHGSAIQDLDEKTVRDGVKLGQAVLRLLDPQRLLRHRTRVAICAAACLQPLEYSPEEVVRMIRAAASGSGDPLSLGLTLTDVADLQVLAVAPVNAPAISGADEVARNGAMPCHLP